MERKARIPLLEELYRQKLAELYDAEQQMGRILPRLVQAYSSAEWHHLLSGYARETQTQCLRLEHLRAARRPLAPRKAKAMSGILAEANELLRRAEPDSEVLALALASVLQDAVGHQITCYACTHNYARLLGFHEDLRPLEQTFHEEKQMEENLLSLSERLGAETVESEAENQQTPARGA